MYWNYYYFKYWFLLCGFYLFMFNQYHHSFVDISCFILLLFYFIRVYTYINIHIYSYIYVHIHTHIYTYICTCIDILLSTVDSGEKCWEKLPFSRYSNELERKRSDRGGWYVKVSNPSVCVPDVIGALACGFQTQKRKSKREIMYLESIFFWAIYALH